VKKSPLVTILSVLFVLTPSLAFAQTPPVDLTVEVKSNTRNGTPVLGDEVTLQLFKGQEQIDSRQAKVDADGKAVFANVPTGPELVAVAGAKHQNMAFRSQPVSLHAAGPFSALVEVFDVSTDAAPLSVGIHHIMIAARGTALEFTEYLQLKNSSDKAIIGSQRDDHDRPVVIHMMLPAGFRDLTASGYLEPEALVTTSDGFYDTMAVPPGEHQVTFSYKVDIDRRTIPIAKTFTLPTAQLLVFWEHGQGRLEGLGEPNDRLVSGQGVPMEYYRRSGLQPGQTVSFQISGFNVKGSDTHTWIVLTGVFAVVVLVAVLRLRPRAKGTGRRHG
jgi:hypothetical protein